MGKDPQSKLSMYAIYTPNEFEKGFCGVGADSDRFTDDTYSCRGLHPSLLAVGRCASQLDLLDPCTGCPLHNSVCWRYSFRWHLEEAQRLGGCMVQCIEDGQLGDGQKIEA